MSNARAFARIEREYRVMKDSWLCHPHIVGSSSALQKTLGKGRVVAKANTSVLIEGATGTGKTVTLQVLGEGFARLGVPVFLADVKGDLSGLSQPGRPHPKIDQRI